MFKKLQKLGEEEFKRRTWIKKNTFNVVVEEVRKAEIWKVWRKWKLSIEDRVLMMLEYWREYRTYFHIATNYGISESNCYRGIKKIEDILLKTKKFSLPWDKVLKEENEVKLVLIDVTESPIERPKKRNEWKTGTITKRNIILEKRKNIHKKHK